MRKILIFSLLAIFTISCKEKDISDENPPSDPKNVIVGTSFLYGDTRLYSDSMQSNNLGYFFFIDEVAVVFSDYCFINYGDTVKKEGLPFAVTLDEPELYITQMAAGSYSGYYGLTIGMDSLSTDTVKENTLPADNSLNDGNYYRSTDGVNHLIVKGRLLDPADPLDSTGSIALDYKIGTFYTIRRKVGPSFNFSLQEESDLPLVLVVDLEPIFNDFDLLAYQKIETDLSNPIDTSIAQEMMDSLEVKLF